MGGTTTFIALSWQLQSNRSNSLHNTRTRQKEFKIISWRLLFSCSSVCLFSWLSICLCVCLGVYIFISVSLSVCLFDHLSVYFLEVNYFVLIWHFLFFLNECFPGIRSDLSIYFTVKINLHYWNILSGNRIIIPQSNFDLLSC